MKRIFSKCFLLLSFLGQAQNFQNKITILQDKINQFEKVGDTLSINYTISLDDLGEFYYSNKKYSEAEKLFLKSLKLKKENLGEKHIEYAYSLHNLGSFYGERGQYLQAESMLLKALEIRCKILGKNNITYLKTLENIAILYAKQGKYSQAEPLFIEVLDIKKSIFGVTNPEYINSLAKTAFFYQSQGNFYQAEPLFLKVLEFKKDFFGEEHLEYADALNDLGMLYYYQKKYSKAEPLYLRALEIRKENLDEKYPDYVTSLNNLGTLYQAQGKYREAEILYLEVIQKDKSDNKKADNSYAIFLNNLASLYDAQKKYSQAQPLYLEILKLKKENLGENNISYSVTLKNLALSYREQGKYIESEPLFLKSLEIKKEILGENHPSYIMNLLNLSVLYRIIGLDQKASFYFEQFTTANQNRIFDDVYTLSEKELIDYVKYNKELLFSPFSFLNDFPFQYPKVNSYSFNNELLVKGLSLRNLELTAKMLQKSSNTELQEKYQQFVFQKKEIKKLQELPLDKRSENIAILTTETEQLEKELSKELSSFSDYKNAMSFTFNDVKNKLTSKEVAIDLVSFNYYKKTVTDSIVYAAFIVKKDSKVPKFISLFEEKQLDFLLGRNKIQLDSTRIDKQYLDKAISDLFLKPLENEFQGITTIYLSPTGLGHQIDFAALPVSGNQTLGEKYNLHFLSSPAEMVDYKITSLDKKSNLEMLLYGGIDYNKSNSKTEIDNEKVVDNSDDIAALRTQSGITGFDYLNGTNKEIDQIEFKGTQNGYITTVFKEREATEESIKALDGRTTPFILHLATHGFFFEDPIQKELPKDIAKLEGKAKIYKASDDPMMRSGLLFAGANNYWNKGTGNITIDDGILTASEISNLDLSACQLVVLSACETGLGEVKGSEGVFGLQRAFKMAGVKNIIMSLWKVPDAQTAELFDVFYSECFTGKTIHEAFQKAQAKMKAKYSPYYWAGFVLLE